MSDGEKSVLAGAAEAAAKDSETKVEEKTDAVVETKAEDKKADVESGKDASKEAKTPPADIELKLPDGTQLNEAALKQFKDLAKETGLKSEGAQKMLDLYLGQHQAALQQMDAARDEWGKQARADKEYGGVNYDKNMVMVGKVMAKFGTPELASFITEAGVGNHPELVRFFYRIGKTISEEALVGNSSGTPAREEKKPIEAVMYPSMQKTA